MKLAIPVFDDDVAPRFCSASEFVVAETSLDGSPSIRRVVFPDEPWSTRLKRLSDGGISVLLCAGFNQHYLPIAEGFGIRVISGLAGKAAQLVEAFYSGDLDRFRFLPRWGKHRGRHRRGLHGRGRKGRRGRNGR